MNPPPLNALVIGAGPSGLACAACLKRAGHRSGINVTILDAADRIGNAWHHHYDRLHLHTARTRSGLPHRPMPKRYGRYPTRADMVEYLADYADAFNLAPRLGITVTSVRPDGAGWSVTHSGGTDHADNVIFATGLNGTAYRPDVPGLDSYTGTTLHSSAYRNAVPFAGQSVLVVGFGNSGGDIALDLAEAGVKVALSVRGPVNILPHELFGIPITSMGGLRKIMPYRWADALTAPILRAKIGRPEDYGLKSAGKGPAAQVIEDGRVPLIDIGTLRAIKAGQIAVHGGIDLIDGSEVRFANGQSTPFDSIVFATGYRTDLRAVLPDTPKALTAAGHPITCGAPGPVPGLYFCSYKASADGQLNQSGTEAMAIAKAIVAG